MKQHRNASSVLREHTKKQVLVYSTRTANWEEDQEERRKRRKRTTPPNISHPVKKKLGIGLKNADFRIPVLFLSKNDGAYSIYMK